MSYANGKITPPVSIDDVKRATGFNNNDLFALVVKDKEQTSWYAFNVGNPTTYSGIIEPNREPWWNIFSQNSPAYWVLFGEYFMPRLKKASYVPDTYNYSCSLEFFAGYDHNAPTISLEYPSNLQTSGGSVKVTISYKLYSSYVINSFSALFPTADWNKLCFLVTDTGKTTILKTIPFSTITDAIVVFDLWLTGTPAYENKGKNWTYNIGVYKYIGASPSETDIQSFEFVCYLTNNTKRYQIDIYATGTLPEPPDPGYDSRLQIQNGSSLVVQLGVNIVFTCSYDVALASCYFILARQGSGGPLDMIVTIFSNGTINYGSQFQGGRFSATIDRGSRLVRLAINLIQASDTADYYFLAYGGTIPSDNPASSAPCRLTVMNEP